MYAGPPETGEAGTVRIVCKMMADTFGFPHRGLWLALGWGSCFEQSGSSFCGVDVEAFSHPLRGFENLVVHSLQSNSDLK